jgi:hypothetical protein
VCTFECVGGARAFQNVHATPLSFKKSPFIVVLEVSLHWFSSCRQWLSGLSSMDIFFILKNYNLILYIVGISISVLILLIFNFCSWHFCRSFIYFQLHPSISICHILCFTISSFFFFVFLLNWFFFLFHHSIKKLFLLLI